MSSLIFVANIYTASRNKRADNGHPCLTPFSILILLDIHPLFITKLFESLYIVFIHLIKEYPNLTLDTGKDFPQSLPNIPQVLPADIVKRRPDLIASQYNLLASKALNKQAMRSLYPSFSLVGSTGASSNVQDLLN